MDLGVWVYLTVRHTRSLRRRLYSPLSASVVE